MQSDVPWQLVYGTMVYVRQTIVSDASKALSRAVCIAVRYSAIRRQFGSQDGSPETQVSAPWKFPDKLMLYQEVYGLSHMNLILPLTLSF